MAKRKTEWPKAAPVVVRWRDSMSTSGWNAEANARGECITVGHLVDRNKDRVAVCQSRSHYSNADVLEIPMVCVKSIKRLKE